MSRLVSVCREGGGGEGGGGGGGGGEPPTIGRRQHLLLVSEGLAMVMELGLGGVDRRPHVQGKELGDFVRNYRTLTRHDLAQAFRITCDDLLQVLGHTVPCVGCRRSVERLFYQLAASGHPTLDPIVVTSDGVVTVSDCALASPNELCTLTHAHSTRLQSLVENQQRSKKSQRCNLHSLESSRSRFVGDHGWRDVWECMSEQCQEEVTFVNFQTLQDTLDNYLRKHRFCGDCRNKVVKAFQLLVEEKEPQKVKGYSSALYAGIKRCLFEKHLHLEAKTEYIESLIERAKPEFLGSDRERHAKTLEIAQEEVLTCLGICIYERLHRISLRLKEEEGTCQVFAAVAIDALRRKFETAVERKRGITKLELLYEEITKEEAAKRQRKEQKKLRKRKKKNCRVGGKCEEVQSDDGKSEHEDEGSCQCTECFAEDNIVSTSLNNNRYADISVEAVDGDSCHSCQNVKTLSSSDKLSRASPGSTVDDCCSGREHSQDCGYSSENNNCCCESGSSSHASSPEGSDVACSEGFCNHSNCDCTADIRADNLSTDNLLHCRKIDKCCDSVFKLTLQDMLLDDSIEDECNDVSYIPMEEIMEFKSRHNVKEKRQELRQILRSRFARLCDNAPQNDT